MMATVGSKCQSRGLIGILVPFIPPTVQIDHVLGAFSRCESTCDDAFGSLHEGCDSRCTERPNADLPVHAPHKNLAPSFVKHG